MDWIMELLMSIMMRIMRSKNDWYGSRGSNEIIITVRSFLFLFVEEFNKNSEIP